MLVSIIRHHLQAEGYVVFVDVLSAVSLSLGGVGHAHFTYAALPTRRPLQVSNAEHYTSKDPAQEGTRRLRATR